jgi:hypothetical protein
MTDTAAPRPVQQRRGVRLLGLIEAQFWSGLVRLLLATLTLERTLCILDALPRRQAAGQVTAPPEAAFRIAGACLGRSLARSQYLRARGHPSVVVIGGLGTIDRFRAHAWLEGDASGQPDFVELRRIER